MAANGGEKKKDKQICQFTTNITASLMMTDSQGGSKKTRVGNFVCFKHTQPCRRDINHKIPFFSSFHILRFSKSGILSVFGKVFQIRTKYRGDNFCVGRKERKLLHRTNGVVSSSAVGESFYGWS